MELRSAALSADDGTPDKNLKKKKIRESKNRKKYWKKADITEVEDFLEEKRFDERIGGDVSLRADEEIYLLDKSTDETSERAFQKKRSDILKEPLRCTQVLRQRSKVAVPLKTNQGRPDDARKSQLQLKREQKVTEKRLRQSDSTVSKRKQLKETEASKVQFRTLNSKTEVYDMWDSSVTQPKEVKKTETGNHIDVLEKPSDAEFLTDDQLAYYSKVTRTSRPKIPALRFKKPSLLPSVEVAKPGASYKPSFEDHQALLSEAHEVEVKKVKQGEHLERVLLNLFPTKEEARAIRVKNEVDEAAGILYSDDESEDLADDANAYTTGNPPVRAENRKTRLQRNRQKAHKERETLTKLKKSEKKLDSQFNRIGVFKKEIKKSQKATEEKKKQREVKKQEAMYLPKKLGPQKFAEPDIEIKLTDELAPSLRQLKPEGSLMVDRMRSLEKRNLIEPRRKTIRKKKWTKIVYKRHYKKGAEDVLTNPKTD